MVHSGDDERNQVPIAEVKPDTWGSRPSESTTTREDTVTLSKSQLRAFLEVIGQVGTLNIGENSEKSGQVRSGPNENGANSTTLPIHCSVSDVQTNGCCSVTSTSQVPGLSTTCPLDSIVPSSSKQLPSTNAQVSPSKLSLSKLEQKRMQWAKEKAEVLDWNPWGKPGAGAPSQRPVASVAPRTDTQLLMVQTSSAVPYSSNSALNSYQSCLPSPTHFRSVVPANELGSNVHDNKANSSYSTSLHPVKPVPPVFRSSIAFGAENEEPLVDEFGRKQQWLKELGYQHEDQRLRRLADQDHTRFSSLPDGDWLNSNNQDLESVSIVGDAAMNAMVPENQQGIRTYIRGQGFKLDPVSAAKAEERRQKAQEYQQAIKLQMEEKQQRVQEERERKKREEEELERRLAEERAKMQLEYEQEQKRIKEKEIEEERKGKVLFSAIQEAQAQAEAEKKSRKGSRQKPSNENAEPSQDNVDSAEKVKKIEGSCPEFKNWDQDQPVATPEGFRSAQQTATVRPIQSLHVDCHSGNVNQDPEKISLSKELGIQTLRSAVTNTGDPEGYVVNRVLTPSFYRIKGRRGHRKDFGTQTDINYGKWIGDDETTDHSCSSSISVPLVNRLTRVQHSKPYKASRHYLGSNVDLSERPKWGVNQPSKSFIRMTDRDPHFVKRKKMQELRKLHWEKEMAIQQSIMNARRSTNPSYSSLRSRRIRSSSDGTAGFSSSEMETSHVRSHSPPRCNRSTLGYRSVCGSAEDVTYYSQSSPYTSTALPSVYRRRDSHSSDNLPSIIGGSEPSPSRLNKMFIDLSKHRGNLPPMRRKWHSQEAFYPHRMGHLREVSPPVPALQKRLLSTQSSSSHMSPPVHSRRKWSDQESFDLESVALSRAKSHRTSSEDGSDRNERDSLSSAESSKKIKTPTDQNPLVHPEVVTGRPTPRQDRILQNLSSLRKGLLQKQRELENFIRHPPMS